MDIGQHAVCHRSRHQVGVHTIVAAPSGRGAGTVPAVTSDATQSSVLENVYRLRGIEIDGYGVRLQHLLVEEHLPEKSAN